MILIDKTKKEKADIISAVDYIEKSCFSVPWSKHSIDSQIFTEGAIFAAAFDDKENPAGFIVGQTVADECELYRIAVCADFRRRGTAAVLMEYFLNECRQRAVKNVFLEVRKENAPARALYEKFGFEAVGVRKNYYTAPPDDAVVYKLEM